MVLVLRERFYHLIWRIYDEVFDDDDDNLDDDDPDADE